VLQGVGLNYASAAAFDWRALMSRAFTKLQGQYLAFIAMYTKLHRRPPAEADIQAYFQVTPPSVHNMIVTLDRRGLISKAPGVARSIQVLVEADRLPTLD
jgi:repressor LexA